ncbi:hypothetical protein [Lysinibacillus irui]|uniref:Uncharacterized protein n=1 Tax=Lysinibacillus irui TaxID=2998077 RepID=A0AAJ5UTR9_9BACI|nr:hypothetical protein [Lysinibacillus irui]WDV09311.1 hypothetical protein OU989_22570 [Lysinibacillus irui]
MDKKSVVMMEDIYPVGRIFIKNAMSFLNVPKNQYSMLTKKYPAPEYLDLKLPKGILDVEVDSHAFGRWNQRVGPFTTNDILTNVFRVAILINPNRVRVLDRNLAILDNDIVFSFEFDNNTLRVTTFFGRISLKPLLLNVENLRRYNSRYKEEVTLDIDSSVLKEQELPITPSSIIEFIDSEDISHIFFYIKSKDGNQTRNFFYHLIRTESLKARENTDKSINSADEAADTVGEYSIMKIDMIHPSRFKLSELELHVLGLLGNIRFLLKYMTQVDPDRIDQLHETHSRTAIRRFAGNKNWNFLKKNK